ncbi:MAG: hypothetical protein V7642_765 [Burkholderiales bacterium]
MSDHTHLSWAGVPLRSFDTMTQYIAGTTTTTTTGLTVTSALKRGSNETGERVPE